MAPRPRVLEAERKQLALRPIDLDGTLPDDHRARLLWQAVEGLDLERFYATIKAVEGGQGRPAIDPKILLTLWLYALSCGVGSARAVARLCGSDDAYRWICGGVSVNHHTLSDFRVEHGEAVEGLITEVLAVLLSKGLVKLERIAHDGMRVRASAGAASFRRRGALERCYDEAASHVKALREELLDDPGAAAERERRARERSAAQREARIKAALAELPKVEALKKRQRDKKDKPVREARVSTTDPDARVMKMGDGGYRPAFNLQFATDVGSGVIVGMSVTNNGSDMGLLDAMLDEVAGRTGRLPKEYLVDGGFAKRESIEHAAARGVTVYTPLMKRGAATIPKRSAAEPRAIREWRARMSSDEGKRIYALRAAAAERPNADLRCYRGLASFNVRGLMKVRAATAWSVLTFNVLRWMHLVAKAA
jgi:transposase